MPGNPNFDDLVTTTLRNRSGKLADNATVTTAFLDRLRRKGKVRPANGGRTIVQELEAFLNPNGSWYAGLDPLNTNLHEPSTAAEYEFKQAAVAAVWTGLEILQNRGEYEVINLVTMRINNAEHSLADMVAQAAYSDGTGFGGKQMAGLGLYVVTSPGTGTVGGIDRATNTFWQNKTATVTVGTINIAATNPSSYIAALNSLSISCTRGKDRPDLYVADGLHYNFYLSSLQGIQRISNNEMAAAGFTNLKYHGVGGDADFVLDNGYCPASTTFALNTDYIYLRPHPERDFVSFGGDRVPTNQDGVVRLVGFTGNLCVSNMKLQGRLFQN